MEMIQVHQIYCALYFYYPRTLMRADGTAAGSLCCL